MIVASSKIDADASEHPRSTAPAPRRSVWFRWLSAVLVGFGGVALLALVATRSLPDALAQSAPEWALWLNPHHPVALLEQAVRLRQRWIGLNLPAIASASGSTPAAADAPSVPADPVLRDRLREEIRGLVIHVLRSDPFNARALRMLAEVTDDREKAREFMMAAVARSRRETHAVFWLLDDNFQRKDYPAALENADIVLRTRPELTNAVVSYLAQIIAEPNGRTIVAQRLAANPPWRLSFFRSLAAALRDPMAPQSLMLQLAQLGSPPSALEQADYLNALIARGQPAIAYFTWLQFLPAAQVATLTLVNNGGFEREPSGVPFDWRIGRGNNVIVTMTEPSSSALRTNRGRTLSLLFEQGRARMPEISQIVILGAGRYRLSGKVSVDIVSPRGLRWRMACSNGNRARLAETDMFSGSSRNWLEFAIDFDVPNDPDCQSQTLQLVHDARSASEELIKGQAWFDDIRLMPAAHSQPG